MTLAQTYFPVWNATTQPRGGGRVLWLGRCFARLLRPLVVRPKSTGCDTMVALQAKSGAAQRWESAVDAPPASPRNTVPSTSARVYLGNVRYAGRADESRTPAAKGRVERHKLRARLTDT
jgi:hypothetical protein